MTVGERCQRAAVSTLTVRGWSTVITQVLPGRAAAATRTETGSESERLDTSPTAPGGGPVVPWSPAPAGGVVDRWAWERLEPWVELRRSLPLGSLFCALRDRLVAGRARPQGSAASSAPLPKQPGFGAGSRRTSWGMRTRTMPREGIPLLQPARGSVARGCGSRPLQHILGVPHLLEVERLDQFA